jgi:D-glycero-D-manno-heptose 1,7-bisphosphate phosphatase
MLIQTYLGTCQRGTFSPEYNSNYSHSKMKNKLLILDLDGTIRSPLSGDFINSPFDQKLIPEAITAMKRWQDAGFTIIGATNQGGVPRYKSLEDCYTEQSETIDLARTEGITITDILFAPGIEGNSLESASMQIIRCSRGGWYRKPNPGMLLVAIECFTEGEDLQIYFSGDRPEDEAACRNCEDHIDPTIAPIFIPHEKWWFSEPPK